MKMSETGMFKIITRDKGENSTPKTQEQKILKQNSQMKQEQVDKKKNKKLTGNPMSKKCNR